MNNLEAIFQAEKSKKEIDGQMYTKLYMAEEKKRWDFLAKLCNDLQFLSSYGYKAKLDTGDFHRGIYIINTKGRHEYDAYLIDTPSNRRVSIGTYSYHEYIISRESLEIRENPSVCNGGSTYVKSIENFIKMLATK